MERRIATKCCLCVWNWDSLNLVYTSALTHCAILVQLVFDARLINFLRTWGERRTPSAWKGHLAHPVLFVFAQKPTNFGSRRTVCELFVDGAAQVRSLIHTYAYLVHEPFTSGLQTIRRAHIYKALEQWSTSIDVCVCSYSQSWKVIEKLKVLSEKRNNFWKWKAKAEKMIEKLKAKSKIFNFENCKRKFYDFAFQLCF